MVHQQQSSPGRTDTEIGEEEATVLHQGYALTPGSTLYLYTTAVNASTNPLTTIPVCNIRQKGLSECTYLGIARVKAKQ